MTWTGQELIPGKSWAANVVFNGKEFVKDLHSQDPRHNISKLYSVLDNRGKNFHLGKYTASHFDFTATAVLADKEDDKHGVIKRYLDRSDAQSKTGPRAGGAPDARMHVQGCQWGVRA